MRITSIVHILSPETDNCPSWISGRERMTVENISWSISTKECCRPRRGLNPRPPGLQSDGTSNWATEAGPEWMYKLSAILTLCQYKNTLQDQFLKGWVMQKLVFRHMQTANAQISLCICAVWSEPSLSATRIIGYYRMYEWRKKAWMILCPRTGWFKSAQFAHTQRHFLAWRNPWDFIKYKHPLLQCTCFF